MRYHSLPGNLPAHRYPPDPWKLVEVEPPDDQDLGLNETLFAVANGYLGMRSNAPEGRNAHSHGTYLNGFHETWPIRHAEAAHAFAKTGQTIVNVPDAKLLKLYVDDEPLLLEEADLEHYERSIDFRTGLGQRKLIWRTPAGKRIRVWSTQMVSLVHRHLAVCTLELELLDDEAPLVISSQLLNRQDGTDEYHVKDAALGEGFDPRQSSGFDRRVLAPQLQRSDEANDGAILGYRCASSGMTIAAGYRHVIESTLPVRTETVVEQDLAKTVIQVRGKAGSVVKIVKYVSYHTSRGVPSPELADRCERTLDRAAETGEAALQREQGERLDKFWADADISIEGSTEDQQAMRWNIFQLAQASTCVNEQGIAAKGVTAGGYDGHYFWDTEVYVVPFLAYTNPEAARKLLRFRWRMLEQAKQRAAELSQVGSLYPWRTINGEEASAYYAAGTAQYHINAAVAQAIERYVVASNDYEFLAKEGAEILVETARLWEDLGFYSNNGTNSFHIHRVTGPDEYTTVVNDNFYTNVMARFNLRYAAATVRWLKAARPDSFAALIRDTKLEDGEIERWEAAADSMYLPFDERLGIHPQDEVFLGLEPWDFAGTPPDNYPLLLHFHPLVIYRHQVLKQADVVLAMFLRGTQFDLDQKRRNFDYYDPITTGDSSLSACVQSAVASQVGARDKAWLYFQHSLYLDLLDTHGNTVDGVHIANAGGAWAAVVSGFAGMSETADGLALHPKLPDAWQKYSFNILRQGSRVKVEVDADGATVSVLAGGDVPIVIDNEIVTASIDKPVTVKPFIST